LQNKEKEIKDNRIGTCKMPRDFLPPEKEQSLLKGHIYIQ